MSENVYFWNVEKCLVDPGRTWTCNLRCRKPTPYPFGHRAALVIKPSWLSVNPQDFNIWLQGYKGVKVLKEICKGESLRFKKVWYLVRTLDHHSSYLLFFHTASPVHILIKETCKWKRFRGSSHICISRLYRDEWGEENDSEKVAVDVKMKAASAFALQSPSSTESSQHNEGGKDDLQEHFSSHSSILFLETPLYGNISTNLLPPGH